MRNVNAFHMPCTLTKKTLCCCTMGMPGNAHYTLVSLSFLVIFFFPRSQINLKITALSIILLIFFFYLLAYFFHIVREEFPSNFFLGGGGRGQSASKISCVVQRVISRKMHSNFLVIMRFHKLFCSLEDTSLLLWVLLSFSVGWHEENTAIILLHSYFLCDRNSFFFYMHITEICCLHFFSVPICHKTNTTEAQIFYST